MQGAILATANKLGRDIQAQRAGIADGARGLPQSQKINFKQGVTANVGGMLEPTVPNIYGSRALAGGLPPSGGGGCSGKLALKRRKASEKRCVI